MVIQVLSGLGLTLFTEKTKLCVFSRDDGTLKVPLMQSNRRGLTEGEYTQSKFRKMRMSLIQ